MDNRYLGNRWRGGVVSRSLLAVCMAIWLAAYVVSSIRLTSERNQLETALQEKSSEKEDVRYMLDKLVEAGVKETFRQKESNRARLQ